jgi:hypothetical protein
MPAQLPDPEPLAQVMRLRMAEDRHTFRSLASLTREQDPRGRGLSYTYLGNVAKGVEPSREAIELIAFALGVNPVGILEYRLALVREQLDPAMVGLDAARATLAAIEGVTGVSESAAGPLRVPGPPEGSELEQLLQDESPSQPGRPPSSTRRPARRSKPA